MLQRWLICSGATNSTTNSSPGRNRKTVGGVFAYRMQHVFLPLLLYSTAVVLNVFVTNLLPVRNNLKNSGHDEVVIEKKYRCD